MIVMTADIHCSPCSRILQLIPALRLWSHGELSCIERKGRNWHSLSNECTQGHGFSHLMVLKHFLAFCMLHWTAAVISVLANKAAASVSWTTCPGNCSRSVLSFLLFSALNACLGGSQLAGELFLHALSSKLVFFKSCGYCRGHSVSSWQLQKQMQMMWIERPWHRVT